MDESTSRCGIDRGRPNGRHGPLAEIAERADLECIRGAESRSVRPGDLPSLLTYGSPCVAAVIALSVAVLMERGLVPEGVFPAALLGNAALASFGGDAPAGVDGF